MEKIIIKYKTHIDDLAKRKKTPEDYHCIRDNIYQEFINDISLNKFSSIDEIKSVAKLIKKKIIKANANVVIWYA